MATKTKTNKATAVKKKKTTTRKTSPSTQFKLFAPDAGEVCLTGDFNNWSTSEFKARRFKDGTWGKMVELKPGRYEYLFLVDGQWWSDPENPNRAANPFGTENSVVTVRS